MEEQQPLIDDSEDEDFTGPTSDIKRLIRRQRGRKSAGDGLHHSDINFRDGTDTETTEDSGDAPDNVVCVFVVAFDTRHGNVLEWSTPDSVELDDVEFKAMPSGAHTVPSDFLYFRKGNFYGLSCFAKIAVQSTEERGCRMKSVGVLTTSYSTLHRYKIFLEDQVVHQLDHPEDYEMLKAFYEEKKGLLPNSGTSSDAADHKLPTVTALIKNTVPGMKITHPIGSFTLLARFFGADIFVLWKLTLLRKRVLFFSPPPIGVVCYRVYCTTCLVKHRYTRLTGQSPKPYFYVNIADIEQLESETSYIACTTEKVFSEKPHLYDAYIDNRVVKSCDPSLKSVIKTNRSDQEKYQQLQQLRQEHVFLERIGEAEHFSEEDMFISFFSNLNNKIFGIIYGVAQSGDKQLTNEHMIGMGLDPNADKEFLLLLLETYDIDATLVVKDPCCPI